MPISYFSKVVAFCRQTTAKLISDTMSILRNILCGRNRKSKRQLLCGLLIFWSAFLIFHFLHRQQVLPSSELVKKQVFRHSAIKLRGEQDTDGFKTQKQILFLLENAPDGTDFRVNGLINLLGTENVHISLAYYEHWKENPSTSMTDFPSDIQLIKELRQNIRLTRVYTPSNISKLQENEVKYDSIIFWVRPSHHYLQMAVKTISHFLTMDGSTRVIIMADEGSVSLNTLLSQNQFLRRKKAERIIRGHRPTNLVDNFEKPNPSILNQARLSSQLKAMVNLETRIYHLGDVVVLPITQYLPFFRRFMYAKRYEILPYVFLKPPALKTSLTQDFNSYKRIILVKHGNVINTESIEWFIMTVLPLIKTTKIILHIVGHVQKRICVAKTDSEVKIVCNSVITRSNLARLYAMSDIAVNPLIKLYPSRIFFGTIEALRHGVPVVTSSADVTINSTNPSVSTIGLEHYGVAQCQIKDAACFANTIKSLLTSHTLKKQAGKAGMEFVKSYFSLTVMKAHLKRLLTHVEARPLRALIQAGCPFQFLNASTIKSIREENGIDIHLYNAQSNDLTIKHKIYTNLSMIPTGHDLHLIVKHSSTKITDRIPSRLCGPRCRVVHIANTLDSAEKLRDKSDEVWLTDDKITDKETTFIKHVPCSSNCRASFHKNCWLQARSFLAQRFEHIIRRRRHRS